VSNIWDQQTLEVFNISTIIIEIAIKGLRHIEKNRLVTTDSAISPSNTCDLYTGENKDDIQWGAILVIFVDTFWTREGEQHLRWTDLEDFNVSIIIIEVAIKGLSCIEENRLLTTDNVISPGTTCDLTQEETRMSGFSRDSHVTRWGPCMIQVSAFQSPALWVSRETEMLLLLSQSSWCLSYHKNLHSSDYIL
jgi:hypothetical protein